MIRVVNIRDYKPKAGETLIRIDRKTPLGNPFVMHNKSERDEVCEKYADYFNTMIKKEGSGLRECMLMVYSIAAGGVIAL